MRRASSTEAVWNAGHLEAFRERFKASNQFRVWDTHPDHDEGFRVDQCNSCVDFLKIFRTYMNESGLHNNSIYAYVHMQETWHSEVYLHNESFPVHFQILCTDVAGKCKATIIVGACLEPVSFFNENNCIYTTLHTSMNTPEHGRWVRFGMCKQNLPRKKIWFFISQATICFSAFLQPYSV